MVFKRLAGGCAVFVLSSSVALAITFGSPDGTLHPNVGGLVVEYGDPPQKVLICSGTLVAPDIFLTAAHCAFGLPVSDVWVTFDTPFDPDTSPLFHGAVHVNPAYTGIPSEPGDMAVVALDDPIDGIPIAQLPTLGFLDQLGASKDLKGAVFTAVGYGTRRESKTGGPHALFPSADTRYYAYSSFDALTKAWLRLSQNPATGDGGTCYGDSGGPNFYGATGVIAALTVTGDRFCRATNVVYRLDTPAAREFLGQYLLCRECLWAPHGRGETRTRRGHLSLTQEGGCRMVLPKDQAEFAIPG